MGALSGRGKGLYPAHSILPITGRHSLLGTSCSVYTVCFGLTASIPLPRGVYGFPSSVSEILIDAVGATFRPGTSLSVCHPVSEAVMARFRCRFWLKCSTTLVSLVADYDPFSDSTFASPWHHLPGRWSRSGFCSFPRFPTGFTPLRSQRRMPW